MNASTADPASARHQLAERLRQLASGFLTNDEFEDGVPSATDHAVREVYRFAWGFYDDFHKHRLRGPHRLSPLQRRVFARCVLFLRSGLPYEWPKSAKWLWCEQVVSPAERRPWWKPDDSVLDEVPFWGSRRRRRREEELDPAIKQAMVDDRIWPFRRMADYKAALKNPPYLAGAAASC